MKKILVTLLLGAFCFMNAGEVLASWAIQIKGGKLLKIEKSPSIITVEDLKKAIQKETDVDVEKQTLKLGIRTLSNEIKLMDVNPAGGWMKVVLEREVVSKKERRDQEMRERLQERQKNRDAKKEERAARKEERDAKKDELRARREERRRGGAAEQQTAAAKHPSYNKNILAKIIEKEKFGYNAVIVAGKNLEHNSNVSYKLYIRENELDEDVSPGTYVEMNKVFPAPSHENLEEVAYYYTNESSEVSVIRQ